MTQETLEIPDLKDYVVRPPTLADAEIVSELANLCTMEVTGLAQYQPNDIEMMWESPGFNKETNVRLVFSPEGQLVAYGSFSDHNEPYVQIGVGARVHPQFRDLGIGEALLAWEEKRALKAVDKAPEGAKVILGSGCNQKDFYTKSLFENLGMDVTRHFFEMEIEFDGPPETPAIPAGILVRPYDEESEIEATAKAYLDSFQDHFGFVEMPVEKIVEQIHFMIEKDPNYDPELWFVAVDGDEIAGLVIGAPRTTEDSEMGYVNILGVRRPWRRRGLGLALLQHVFVEFYKRGSKRASLGVDASSLTGATRLYKKAGMYVNRRYDNYEKVLREGQDLRRTS